MMKSLRFFPPGGPEKLRYDSEPRPRDPQGDEVLIKVHAAGLIHPELTWSAAYQDAEGKWISHIPGHDFSGTIEAVGDEVQSKDLKPGVEVCAFTSRRNHEGGMAEYALADADQVAIKPHNLSLVEAASVPLSALTAWQALFDHGKLQAGQKLLVNGAAGGTGIYAMQFGKGTGAKVYATGSSPRSRQLAQDFGVDEFIDYKNTKMEDIVQDVDLILDCVGEKALEQSFKVLKPDGLVISIVNFDCEQLARKHGLHGLFFIVSMNSEQFAQISKLIEEGKVKPVVDKVFKLEDGVKAFQEAAEGHVHGKIIIQVGD